MVFDRDRKFDVEVPKFLKASGVQAVRTSVRSPWQNGVAERWVGSIRREMLDHVIPLNERHLMRLSQNYLSSYHEDRTHIGLNKETPGARPVESRPTAPAKVHDLAAYRRVTSPVHLVSRSLTNESRTTFFCLSLVGIFVAAIGLLRSHAENGLEGTHEARFPSGIWRQPVPNSTVTIGPNQMQIQF